MTEILISNPGGIFGMSCEETFAIIAIIIFVLGGIKEYLEEKRVIKRH